MSIIGAQQAVLSLRFVDCCLSINRIESLLISCENISNDNSQVIKKKLQAYFLFNFFFTSQKIFIIINSFPPPPFHSKG